MKKLIEALHAIQEECDKYVTSDGDIRCEDCPMSYKNGCAVTDLPPCNWKINDEIQKALL